LTQKNKSEIEEFLQNETAQEKPSERARNKAVEGAQTAADSGRGARRESERRVLETHTSELNDAATTDRSSGRLSAEESSEVERTIALDKARSNIENRSEGGLRAYLSSVELPETESNEVRESLVELGSLVRSLGDEPFGATVQKRSKIDPGTYIGAGKAEEVAAAAKELNCSYVAFDQELSPSQVRNLEKIMELPVLDRTGIILQIFRKNAKTRESKTQVEIAQLEFLAPRLSNSWVTFERQRGGGGTKVRGAGETQLELDRRKIKDKISSLKKELIKIQKERETQRKSRHDEYNVVLVGYTNAGKTTVMNGLTDSHFVAKDALFETLDSTVRQLKGTAGHPKILLTDTVGFIRNLPHGLVASFRSTLEETARADLLLHVVDVSHPHYKQHMQVTDEVLKEVGAAEVPRMVVFNKFDNIKGEPRLQKILARSYPRCVCMSAEQDGDSHKLRDSIEDYFLSQMKEITLMVSYKNTKLMSLIHAHTRIIETVWSDEGAAMKVRMPTETYAKYFEKQEIEDLAETPESSDSWKVEGF
jgi:GTPase